ncbi:hypothetical protein JCGZ_06386 [Jatropha curcas]|uniref:Uncharacterized protein n=1 Tax=Jatropha curcas TaxID=180498 RepID=A0A067J9G7_JATCU|nr:hypothetical protein JCGZ_06386 [Jatropha curcas]
MEARMNEALAAQRTGLIAELGSGNGNGASTMGRDPATSNQGPAATPTVNTQILRLKEPAFPDCKQFGRTEGHFESLPKVCQYGT